MSRSRLPLVVLACFLFLAAPSAGDPPSEPEEQLLPIGLTEEEKTRLHEIGMYHVDTPPPTGKVRNPSEWEPSEGVIIRWPLGVTVALIAEMSEDVMVTTIVANASAEQSARDTYTAGGVNMANVAFIHASTNSIWTRDYGPWFIFEDDRLGIVDHIYNRPRPLDDVIPQVIGAEWGLDVFGMDLEHAGGNYMSDGLGMSASTELVYNENAGMTPAQVDQTILDYLGNDYTVLDYIQSSGIHHIDCWAKYLGPSTVMVKDVSPSDPTYDDLNAHADFLSQQISPWGVPYNVVRVYCPPGTWYTNSLILNGKVLVPLFGNSEDAIALQTYADAMPGYEVLGFTGSWASEDALHCRTMGVPDRGVLRIEHVPFNNGDVTSGDYEIETTITPHSGAPLVPDELVVRYSTDGGPWQEAPLVAAGEPGSFVGTIPAQPEDSEIAYYLEAADESGRRETHPYIGEAWAHRFAAICPNHPEVGVAPGGPLVACVGSTQPLTANLTGGTGPFTYQWTEDGVPIPGATSSTYDALGVGTHNYDCQVWGDGCTNPRTSPDPVELTWQTEPVFGGLASVASPQNATCTLDLSWAPATPVCGTAAHYSIYRSTTPGFTPGPANLLVQGVAGTGFSDLADLESDTAYHYVVRARDDSNGVEELNTIEVASSPSGPGGGTQTLFDDDFENPDDWLSWQVSNGPGPFGCGKWARVDSPTQRPPNSLGYYALTDSNACGPGSETSTILTSPAIDCATSGALSVTLEYDLYYHYLNGDDTTVEVWDGAGWQTVWTAPASTVQTHHVLDVTPYAVGNPGFQVRFSYQNAAYDYWFAVDNVLVTGGIGGSCVPGSAAVVSVPDGSEGGTDPLLATRNGNDDEISWDVTTPGCASAGHHLIWGWGSDLSSYRVSGSDCTLDTSGSHLWSTSPDASADWVWFLVVGNDGGAVESGWGTDSFLNERGTVASGECGALAVAPAACVP
jgi:agmatine/peptidylarginine deiminase